MVKNRRPRFRTLLLGAAVVLAAFGSEPLPAQYFGRNKVQFQTFDFQVLHTEHFDVYYYPEEETASLDASRMAERWYQRLSVLLDHRFEERQPLVLYGSHPAFQQTTTLGGQIGEGTGGVTEGLKQRVIMPLSGSYQETDHVLGHELVHAFQYDISGLGRSRGNLSAQARALASAPLWFIEGMAEYLSVGPVDPQTAMVLRDAALHGDVPSIQQMTSDPRRSPYRWGHALWAYISGRWGDPVVGMILRRLDQGVSYSRAMEEVLGIPLEELSGDWQAAVRRAYLPMLSERPEPKEVAKPLITGDGSGGRLNVGPAISPDGRLVAFLSEREFLDVELWLADAATGQVIRRLREGSALDPHFQSLRYINSAGSFSPDGTQFVFSALSGGRDVLLILDVSDGDVVREIEVPGLAEILSPSWSTDGTTIVFSGVRGGISDLYLLDVASGEARRLTDDPHADLHPSLSPDGRFIVFASDRGPETDFATLAFAGYRLALLEVETGAVRVIEGLENLNAIDPEWSSDGGGLFFIANRNGIPNVYRFEVETETLSQVTDLFGAVSGVTDISPALAVARTSERLLFTAFEENGYNIYALNGEELAGEEVHHARSGHGTSESAAALPPVPRPTEEVYNQVANFIADPTFGLPTPADLAEWRITPYEPRLALDYLGQPSIGFAVGGPQGLGGLSGGISALFSDVLGYHNVAASVRVSSQIDLFGFSVAYLNRRQRLNYGAIAQRVPSTSLGRRLLFDEETEEVRDQVLRFRTFDTELMAVAQYPFSQAQRLEWTGGYRRRSQDVEGVEIVGTPIFSDGNIIGYDPIERRDAQLEDLDDTWNLFETSFALVYDNALFGVTSPFAGQRYRFDVTPTLGTINFAQLLLDYRRYVWFRPFTLALQGLHFGRYGEDAENNFAPLFLGRPSLVRGYWELYNDCRGLSDDCATEVVERLFGSRIATAKAELRFPLIRTIVLGGGLRLPGIEGFAFADGGIAWNQGALPSSDEIISDDEGWVGSVGVGARVSLLGIAVLEVDYVRPLEDALGWHWQFALQPGF